jgi:hypothetical protein
LSAALSTSGLEQNRDDPPSGWQDSLTIGAYWLVALEPDLPNAAFQGLARTLNSSHRGAAKQAAAAKGRMQMFGHSSRRNIAAIVAAIAMSTIAVGAAVGPAQAASTSTQMVSHA